MAKMSDADLLGFLESEADSAFEYMSGTAAQDRTRAMREYLRMPYGNEEDGRSNVVASDVFDSVEGMLPDLIEVFVSTDEAVRFDPVGAEDEAGAQQATDACNYVFYKQNNGFMTLYTAGKDALTLRTGGVKWCWEEKRTPSFTTYKDVPEMQLAMFVMTNPDAVITEQDPSDEPVQMPDGTMQTVYTIKVKTVETKGSVRVYNIPPDELRVSRNHNSVLLDECPYVAHVCKKSKSDIMQMGFKVSDTDITSAQSEETTTDRELRNRLRQDYIVGDRDSIDPAQKMGWLREEYVIVDYDGDGIAERRRIIRLGQKILENQECSHVQIAAWTPYILTHRFEGISVADLASDFQRIQTEIVRQNLDNIQLANNNETVVTMDASGNPMANIDDLLNRRPGGVIREKMPGAVRPYFDHAKSMETSGFQELMHSAKENRTGFTRYSQGLDSNSLNKTAHGLQQIMNASQKRMKLMARIMAEALVAPMFKGIFKTLTDYCMDKLSFRMNGEFVQYDPQEWRDGYDMTINVGIGAGDKLQQMQMLGGIEAAQAAIIQGGGMGTLVTPMNIFNLQKRKVELAGFKNPAEFFTRPPDQMPPPPPPPPDPKAQIEGAKLQQDGQKFQATQSAEAQKFQAETAFKSQEAEKDRQLQIALERMRQEFQAGMKTLEHGMSQQATQEQDDAAAEAKEPENLMLQAMLQAVQALSAPKVKQARAVKQADGTWLMESVEGAQSPEAVQ